MVEWSFIDSLASQTEGCKVVEDKTSKYRPQHEWCINGKSVAWERPLSKKDMALLGDKAPKGRVLAIRMPNLKTRDAWVETVPGPCFASQHFLNYPAVLVDLELADEDLVRELFADGVIAIVGSSN